MPSVEAWARWAAAEGVVHVEVGEAGQRLREGRVVRLLAGVEAQVLEQQQVARPQLVDRHLTPGPERVAGHAHRAPEQLAEPLRDRLAGAARR